MVPLGNVLSPLSFCALLPAHREEAQKRAFSECVSTADVCWDKRKRLEAVPRGTIVSPDSSILVDKSMSSARCTSRCPTAPVTSSTRWHDVLASPLSLRSASTSSRRRWSSCVPAQHTHKSRSVAYHGCQLGPQHPHSYAQMPAPLMLLQPTRTWTGLSGQPKGTGGGDAAGIVEIRVAAAAASRPTAARPGDALHLTPAAPHHLSAVTGRGPCASMDRTHALNTAEQPWLYAEAHGASRQH